MLFASNVTGKALIFVFSCLIGVLRIIKILPVVIEKIAGAIVLLCCEAVFVVVFIMGLHIWGLQDDLQALGHKSSELLLSMVFGRLGAMAICLCAFFAFIWSSVYIIRHFKH